MTKHWKLLVATHIAAAGAGYWRAPREILDQEVTRSSWFQTDTKSVLSATVESLRAENQLLVYSYKGLVGVSVERTKWWIFGGRQQLVVPAHVNYLLDLSQLTLDKVSFDDRSKIVTVKLDGLKLGPIAFQPERALTVNGGWLTWNDEQVEELRKLNYASARLAMTKQAQSEPIVQAAKAQAKKNVQDYFEVPLRIVGKPDVKVVATFAS